MNPKITFVAVQVVLVVSMFCAGLVVGHIRAATSGSTSEAYVCGFGDGANYALKRLSLEPMEVKQKCSQYRDPLQ
jgi:hypothetical protein